MNDVLQDIPSDDCRYAAAHSGVTSLGVLQSGTSEDENEEEVEEEMFMTPPETLPGYGFTVIKLFDSNCHLLAK